MKHIPVLSAIFLSSSILGFADPLPEVPPTVTPLSATSFNLDWDGTLGNTYFVQYSSDLISWDYMPIIKSGIGGPLGYGFNAAGGKLFLRLHYTDTPTSNPLTADFDNDGISNWDEVREGGNNTDPFLYQDLNGNGIADDWELFWNSEFSVFPKPLKAELSYRGNTTKNIYLSNPVSPDANFTITLQNNIAPNQVGYTSTDSITGTAVYSWNDISTTGTSIVSLSSVDDGSAEVALTQITIPFYGTSYNKVFVSSNGRIMFGSGNAYSSNTGIPNASTPNLFIAPFWDDLDTRTSGEIYYKEESDKLIVQFEEVGRYSGSATEIYTFQAVLHTNGKIEFFYKSMTGALESSTIGVENNDGSDGLEIVNNSSYIQNLMAVTISTSPVNFVEVSPLSGTTLAGNISTLVATFNSWDLPPGTYTANIQVSHTGTGTSPWNTSAILEVTNPPTNISITSPSDGDTLLSSQNIYFRVTATDDDFGVERVEFYDGTTKLGETTSSYTSYSYSWYNVTAGTHELTAKAIDQLGTETISSIVTVTVLADSDHDSMADAWEMLHFGDLDESPYDDFDNDGYTNKEEYEGGHNPKVVEDTDADGMPDGWEEDNNFDLEVDDAGDDEDNDGLSNLQEWQNQTRPRDNDTDNDKLPDGWEVQYGLNPKLNDSALDADNDGVSNLIEYALGFNPSSNDSDNDTILDSSEDRDGDGMPDAWEAETGKWKREYNNQTYQYDNIFTKSLDWEIDDASKDLDNDGLTNLQEYQIGTKPNNFDTDGDLLPDGWEVDYNLNPLSAVGNDGAEGDIETDVTGQTGDGVNNFDEWVFGSNPRASDTNGDGTSDLSSINMGNAPSGSTSAVNTTEPVEVSFSIGDDSGTHSERWILIIRGTNSAVDDKTIKFASREFGKVETRKFKLKRGGKYELTLKHVGTNREEGVDYDWDAQVESKPSSKVKNPDTEGSHYIVSVDNAHWIVNNEDGLLGVNDGGAIEDTDASIGRKAFLLPVEFVDKDEKVIDHANIALWEKALPPHRSQTLDDNEVIPALEIKEDFVEVDDRRFYVRLAKIVADNVVVKGTLKTFSKGDNPETDAPLDKIDDFEMKVSQDSQYLISPAFILVVDSYDDHFVQTPDVDGTDGASDDQTIKAELEGIVEVSLEIGGETIKLTMSVSDTKNNEIRYVKLNLINMKKQDGVNTFWTKAEIIKAVRDANRIWAQACIKFVNQSGNDITEADIIELNQPEGITLDGSSDPDDPESALSLDATEDFALLTGVKNNMADDIDVVFVGETDPTTIGRAYFNKGLNEITDILPEVKSAVINSVIMEDKAKTVFNTLGHEIGHLLLDCKHLHLHPDSAQDEDGNWNIVVYSSADPYAQQALTRINQYEFPEDINVMNVGGTPVEGVPLIIHNDVLARKRMLIEQVEASRTLTNLPYKSE